MDLGERWFELAWGPPARIDDLPLEVDGARLELAAHAGSPGLLLDVTLRAGARGLRRGVEHRSTNLFPFLFAFEADGVPVVVEETLHAKDGGMRSLVDLVPPRGERTWTLRLASASLDGVAPRPFPARLSVTAAFCELQHDTVSATDLRAPPTAPRDVGLRIVPPALIRSQRVDLVRGPDGWRPAE